MFLTDSLANSLANSLLQCVLKQFAQIICSAQSPARTGFPRRPPPSTPSQPCTPAGMGVGGGGWVCGGGGAGHRTGAAPARTEPTATVTAATTRSPTFSLVALGSRLLMWPETDSEKAAKHYDLIFQFSSRNHLSFVLSQSQWFVSSTF